MKNICIFLILLLVPFTVKAECKGHFAIRNGESLSICIDNNEDVVVETALNIFKGDYYQLFNAKTVRDSAENAKIFITTLGENSSGLQKFLVGQKIDFSSINKKHEAFIIKVFRYNDENKLALIGSDKRGTAYALMTLSRMMGVSPWEWWADCKTKPIKSFSLPSDYEKSDSPSVAYRGLFINDEDWGFNPWSSKNYEPQQRGKNHENTDIRKGEIGPYTHARLFELMMRLKANTFWPAMHSCSKPFFFTKGNLEEARRYGIIVSTSHCEPMMRNTNGEWRKNVSGEYDFVHNSDNVLNFWKERVEQTKDIDCIYTLGMRGTHDGEMKGASGVENQTKVLQQIIGDQREMLGSCLKKKIATIPQQFIPYKEVLDCYNAGLKVPDDVTLMWCDDNYGYIRHFPNAEERSRNGGSGIYYHVSYWGCPEDYLWLSTTHPELIFTEMSRAYHKGIDKIWILNVGDLKPAEYSLSLFLDMAWDIKNVEREGVEKHLENWYAEQTGMRNKTLSELWKNYYDLSFRYRPEFLGGTKIQVKGGIVKKVMDVPLTREEINRRISVCKEMESKVKNLKKKADPQRSDAWFELIEYPIRCMANMNIKMLTAQLARHGYAKWKMAHESFDTIKKLTEEYNSLSDSKWKYMMNYQPRQLPVFAPVTETRDTTALPLKEDGKQIFISKNILGEEIKPGCLKVLSFATSANLSTTIKIKALPLHPSENETIRYEVTLDNETPEVVSLETAMRSIEWQKNVLRNYSLKEFKFPLKGKTKRHTLKIKALDEGIFIQEVIVD